MISNAEGTRGDAGYDHSYAYGRFNPPGSKRLSAMSLDEVSGLQGEMIRRTSPSSVVGKYQIKDDTLAELRAKLKLSGSKPFTPALQDRLGRELLQRRGYEAYLAERITPEAFQNSLSREWSSLPRDGANHSYYGRQINTRTSTNEVQSALKLAREVFSRNLDEGRLPPPFGWR